MRPIILALLLSLVASPALAHGGGGHSGNTTTTTSPVHVNGYTTKNGTVVNSYDRTAPNGTKDDNWSARGNYNPETGAAGTKPSDSGGYANMPYVGEIRTINAWNGYAYAPTMCQWDGRYWIRI